MNEDIKPLMSEEKRQEVLANFKANNPKSNSSLGVLKTISVIGFLISVVSAVVLFAADSALTAMIASSLIPAGLTVGFFSLIAYLAVKAVIESKE